MKLIKETTARQKAIKLFKHPSSMGRIKTFAILTFNNQDKEYQTRDVNNEQNKELKNILNQERFEKTLKGFTTYYKIKGKYGNREDSFIIYNITLKEASDLAKVGHQQSFIFGINKDNKLTFQFYANNSKSGYNYIKVDEREGFDILDKEAEDYYSQISRDFKFSIPFETFEASQEDLIEMLESRCNISDEYKNNLDFYIEESLNDNYNSKYRNICRLRIYGNSYKEFLNNN